MPAKMIVELPSGRKLLFGGKGTSRGLAEVGLADDIAQATSDKFKAGMATLADLVGTLEQSVGRMARRPDKIEMEFRASLSADCDLWVVSGDVEAEFKVTVSWDSKEQPQPPPV